MKEKETREFMKEHEWLYDQLRDFQTPAAIDNDTGEIIELKAKSKPKRNDLEKFDAGIFSRFNINAWRLLTTQLSPHELKIVVLMSVMAKPFSNSLSPLNDDTSMSKLSEIFGLDRTSIKKMLVKLFRLSVYGKFELHEQNESYQKYWILNPFISFNGRAIKKGVPSLFENTTYAKL